MGVGSSKIFWIDRKFPTFNLGKMIEKQRNEGGWVGPGRQRYGNSANRLWRGHVLRFSGYDIMYDTYHRYDR